MRVLIVTQYFWPENFRINDLVRGLKQRGHELSVLTGLPNYPQGRLYEGYGFLSGPYHEHYEGIPVHRVPLVTRGTSRGVRLALNFASFALTASVLAPFLIRERFDAILCYEPSPITVALPAIALRHLRRKPLAFWVQDLWPETLSATGAVRSPGIIAAVRSLVRFIYRNCDRVLVSSPGFVQHAVQHGAARERVEYFPNWAEAFYRPMGRDEARAIAPDVPEGGVRLMFAGNLGSAQALGTIIKAAAKLRHRHDIQWLIVGEGAERPMLERMILEEGVGHVVHLLGPRPADKMPAYFALADGLLVTLRDEPVFALTLPSKMQSYFACGRPVVAALPGDGGRIVEQAGAGASCAPGDPDALARLTEQFAALSASERESMGANARRYFELHFEREALLDRLEVILSELSVESRCAS
jgi:colanic acid biosynthesis glycosyl transferase WcaI